MKMDDSIISSKRLAYLDILKGIGILLVVIGHIYSNKIACDWIYSFHMPLFFFAAGWLYKEKSIKADIIRRSQTIVIPYFCFGTLILIYWQLFERLFRDSDMSFTASLYGLISGQYNYLDFNVHLWFLPCFFLVTVLYNALAYTGGGIYGRRLAAIVSIFMSAVYILIPLPPLPWGLDRAFKYIVFYSIGTYASANHMEEKIKSFSLPRKLIAAAVLLGINFALSYIGLDTGIMYFVTAAIGIMSMLIISIAVSKNMVLEHLGSISLVILCLHGPVYRVLVKAMSIPLRMSTDAVRENLLLTMIVTAFTLCVCELAYQIIYRMMPWMIGKKKESVITESL